MRLIVYSHDAFGLGNIRRMLAICQHLQTAISELSILVISGSPAIHSFRIPQQIDYIKLPCLGRDRFGKMAAKYLGTDVANTIKLRANLIKTAVIDFKPDLVLVDKKPYGLLGELQPALDYLKTSLSKTKIVLLLRDILDDPQTTIAQWQQQGFYEAIQHYYDRVLIAGMPEVFNPIEEYNFPPIVADKTRFCGYIRKFPELSSPDFIRRQLRVKSGEKLILVTPGGGEDGYELIKTYLSGLSAISNQHKIKTLIVFGSEMPVKERELLRQQVNKIKSVTALEFTDNLMNYMAAADLIVSMAGYNTTTEILSLQKQAVVIPRYKPSSEQFIRANRMANMGLFTTVNPHNLTVRKLKNAIAYCLQSNQEHSSSLFNLNLDGLNAIEREIASLLDEKQKLKLSYASTQLSAIETTKDSYPLPI